MDSAKLVFIHVIFDVVDFIPMAYSEISETIAQLLPPLTLSELSIEKKRERNRMSQRDLFTGTVVLLLAEWVQVLERSNYGCFLAANKNHSCSVEVQPQKLRHFDSEKFDSINCSMRIKKQKTF